MKIGPDVFIQKLGQKCKSLISDKKFSEILVGSAWALVARVLSVSLGMAATIIVVRVYGADVLGILAIITSFLLLTTIFTVLGTNTSILRLIPEHLVKYSATSAFNVYRKTQYMVITISVVTGSLLFLVAAPIANKVFGKPNLSFYLALAAVFVVFKSLMLLNTQAVRGLRLIRVFALMQTLPQGFNLALLGVLGLLLTSKNVPVYSLLGGFALTGILGWVIMECEFRRRIHTNDHVKTMPIKEILSLSFPMLMTATMTLVIGQTGVIILGMFRTETEVGYYAIAVKLANLTTYVLAAINSMAGPKFSELYHAGKIDELFYVAKKSAKLIFWTTTPVLILLICLGKSILIHVFGEEFASAYGAMIFLVLGQFVNSISGSTGLFMNMAGKERQFRNILLSAAFGNVMLNLFLIPILGIVGAAIAAMSSLAFWNLFTLMYIKMKYSRTIGYIPLMGAWISKPGLMS